MHIPTDSTYFKLLKEPHLSLPSTVSTAAKGIFQSGPNTTGTAVFRDKRQTSCLGCAYHFTSGKITIYDEQGHRLEVQGPQNKVGPSIINLLLLQYILTLKTRRDSSSL